MFKCTVPDGENAEGTCVVSRSMMRLGTDRVAGVGWLAWKATAPFVERIFANFGTKLFFNNCV